MRAARGDAGVLSGAWAKAGEDRVGPGDGEFQCCRVGVRQVGGDGADLGGQLAGLLVWVADDGGDVVACGDGLFEQLVADPAGGRDDGELHRLLPLYRERFPRYAFLRR